MNFTATTIKISNGAITIPIPRDEMYQLNDIWGDIKSGREMTVDISRKRKKRSIDANAYLWVLLTEMAAVLRTTKDELYRDALFKYGTVLTHAVVKPEAVEKFKKEWHGAVREIGDPIEVDGEHGKTMGVQLQIFAGSSTYDSKQFSRLLDGVIEDAKELGIKVLSKKEQAQIIEALGRK